MDNYYTFTVSFVPFLVELLIILGLFLICREIVCWYWKINEAIATLKSIDEKLSVQINVMTKSQHGTP
jgi:hypothetical protein